VGIAGVLLSPTLPIEVYVKGSAKEHLCISLPGVADGEYLPFPGYVTDLHLMQSLYCCRTADAVANIIKLKPHGTLAVKQVT
jgi:hypothetical protein